MTDTLLPLALFALSTLFTPGPNNLMLMASGANFGLVRSLPHLCGVALGFPMMLIPVGLGMMQVFDLWPGAMVLLKGLAVVAVLWIAWKIANTAPPGADQDRPSGRPLSFAQAVAFQWINPKAWSMALGAITLFAASGAFSAVLMVAGVFAALGLCSATTWTTLGTGLRRFLATGQRARVFNLCMAALLVLSMGPVLFA